jgi:hypothetical protein
MALGLTNADDADPQKDFAHAFGDALSAYLDATESVSALPRGHSE